MSENRAMNWHAPSLLALLSILCALAIAGCSTPPNEVMQFREGVLRATTYTQAQLYCDNKNQTPRWLGKAPAESGVLFRCD